jgi:hypothetical protein
MSSSEPGGRVGCCQRSVHVQVCVRVQEEEEEGDEQHGHIALGRARNGKHTRPNWAGVFFG